MGIPVLIMGESGSGKTTSLRNFGANDITFLNVSSKLLPFKGKFTINKRGATYVDIANALNGKYTNTYVIDDANYLMCFESFDKAKETGYGKFTDMAKNFYDMLKYIINNTPDDTIVYLLAHTEQSEVTGKIKMKTIGKMLDSQLTVEGLFDIVLLATADNGKFRFITHSDGTNTAKSPMGMFENNDIDNDLKMVDDTIREYWSLPPRRGYVAKKTSTVAPKSKTV